MKDELTFGDKVKLIGGDPDMINIGFIIAIILIPGNTKYRISIAGDVVELFDFEFIKV